MSFITPPGWSGGIVKKVGGAVAGAASGALKPRGSFGGGGGRKYPTKKGKVVTLPNGVRVGIDPKQKKFPPKGGVSVGGKNLNEPRQGGKKKRGGTVITGGGGGTKPPVTSTPPPVNPSGNKPGGGKTGGGKTGGGKGGKGGGKGGRTGGKNGTVTTPVSSGKKPVVNFNAKKMAQSLTDLGYNADIAAVQRQIDQTRGQMENALKDIQGWGQQLMADHNVNAADTNQAWQDALSGAQASDANIAQLFGGVAAGENAAFSNVGEDMLSTMGASDAAFNKRFGEALNAQTADNSRRLQNMYQQQIGNLQANAQQLQQQKGDAYAKNLIDMLQMKWGRQDQLIQQQVALEGLAQSRELMGYDKQKAQNEVTGGRLANQAQRLANKQAMQAIKAAEQKTGGFDWTDPNTPATVANALFTGSISPNGTLVMNPKKVWANVLDLMNNTYGVAGNPQAYQAAMALFRVVLRKSHAAGAWKAYKINDKGQIVYNPAGK